MEKHITVPSWMISLVSMHLFFLNAGYLLAVFKFLLPLSVGLNIVAKILFYVWLVPSVPMAIVMLIFFSIAMTVHPSKATTTESKKHRN